MYIHLHDCNIFVSIEEQFDYLSGLNTEKRLPRIDGTLTHSHPIF